MSRFVRGSEGCSSLRAEGTLDGSRSFQADPHSVNRSATSVSATPSATHAATMPAIVPLLMPRAGAGVGGGGIAGAGPGPLGAACAVGAFIATVFAGAGRALEPDEGPAPSGSEGRAVGATRTIAVPGGPKGRSASANSAADWKRSSGFFWSAFASTSDSPAGNFLFGMRSSSAIGGFVSCSWMCSFGVFASKVSLPVRTSYRIAASE